MVRNALVLACVLGACTYYGAQGALSLASSFARDSQAQTQAKSSRETIRTYTVTRSVLDDNVTTGSISRAAQRVQLDPCKK